MIKNKFLATASAFALASAFSTQASAVVVPATGGTAAGYTVNADVTVTGTVSNAGATGTDTVAIGAGAAGKTLTVSTGTITATVSNTIETTADAAGFNITVGAGGTISNTTNAATTIKLDDDIGTITNAGTILSTAGGIAIETTAALTADITNSGLIRDTTTGSAIKVGGALTGTITNTGTLRAGAAAAGVLNIDANVSGGLINSGTIESTTGNVNTVNIATGVNMNTTNSAGGVISAAGTGTTFLYAGTSTSNLTNAGTITNSSTGSVIQNAGILTGTITNTGIISSTGAGATNGVVNIDADVTGGLINSGTISSAAGNVATINVAADSDMDITNSVGGSITGAGTAGTIIFAGASTSDVSNSGTISNSSTGAAFQNVGILTGTITNETDGVIQGAAAANGVLDIDEDVTGGLVNKGTIKTTTGNVSAIVVAATKDMDITNTGTISAAGTAATISYAGATESDIINSAGGTISNTSTGSGINTVGAVTGLITNAGTISITGAGIGINVDSTVSGSVTNSGTITVAAAGVGIDVAAAVAGTITNSGTISVATGGSGIKLSNAAGTATGGIVNTGTINAAANGVTNGVAFDGDTTEVATTFTNTGGTIVGDIQLGVGGVTQTLNLNGGSLDGDITGAAGIDVITISGDFTMTDTGGLATIVTGGTNEDTINIGLASTDDFVAGGAITGVEHMNLNFGTFSTAFGISGANDSVFGIDAGTTFTATADLTVAIDDITVEGDAVVNDDVTVTITDDAAGASAVVVAEDASVTFGVSGSDEAEDVAHGSLAITGTLTVQDGAIINLDLSGLGGAIATAEDANFTVATTTAGLTMDAEAVTINDGSIVYTTTITDDADDLIVNVVRDGYTVATTANGDAIGAILEANLTSFDALVAELDNSATVAALNSNLDQLTPEVNGGVQGVAVDASVANADAVDMRLASLRDGSGVAAGGMAAAESGFWGKLVGKKADQDTRDGIAGYDADIWGVSGGFDRSVSDSIRLGVGLGYSNADVDSARGDAEVDSYHLSFYGDYVVNNWNFTGLLGYSYNDYDLNRNIVIGAIDDVATAETDGSTYIAQVGAGYTLDNVSGPLKVTPNALLRYTNTSVDEYTETGSTLDLAVDTENNQKLETGLGVDVAYPISSGGLTYTPRVKAQWLYDLIGDEFETNSAFNSAGTTFVTQGADVARNTFVVGAGLDVLTQDNITVSFDYDLTAREDYDAHTGTLNARFAF